MDLVTYDSDIQMFRSPPRELNVDVLLFCRYLIEHERLETRRDDEGEG